MHPNPQLSLPSWVLTKTHLLRTVIFRTLLFLVIVCSFPETATAQLFKFPAPDTLSGNYFGGSVAIDGNIAIVGSTGYNSCGTNSGAAFIYVKAANNTWSLDHVLQPSDCQEDHFFGKTVAISGSRVLVTSFRSAFNQRVSNGAYVFEKQGDRWIQTARFSDPDRGEYGTFASAIALDGKRFIVTAAGVGSGQKARGAGYIFEKGPDSLWTNTGRITAESNRFNGVFGTSCDLDGNRIAISSSSYTPGQPGKISIFDYSASDSKWSQTASIDKVMAFFMPLDLDGDRLVVGESKAERDQSGRVRLFEFDGKKWNLTLTLKPHIPYSAGAFGSLVSIHGNTIFVVGFDEQLELNYNVDRVVYVFQKTDKEWRQRTILDIGSPFFGTSLSVSSSAALIGQAPENQPGAVYAVPLNRP
jgi:hypothetical protein